MATLEKSQAARIAGVLCAAWYKLDNRALRAMPGSPRQKELRAQSAEASNDFKTFRHAFAPDYVAPHEKL